MDKGQLKKKNKMSFQKSLENASKTKKEQIYSFGPDLEIVITPLKSTVQRLGNSVRENTRLAEAILSTISSTKKPQWTQFDGVPMKIVIRGKLPIVQKNLVFTGKSLLYKEPRNNNMIWLKRYQVRQCCQGVFPGIPTSSLSSGLTSGQGECPPRGLVGQTYCQKMLAKFRASGDRKA